MAGFWDLLILNFFLVLLGCSLSSGHKIPLNTINSLESPNHLQDNNNLALLDFEVDANERQKRELEMMGNEGLDYPVSENQEDASEEGFWDKVVKVALKMFNRFVQWLNSSD